MPTITPAEVPRDLHGGTVAPGLTEDGIVNAQALRAAHQRRVANRSLTLQYQYGQQRNGTRTQTAVATYRYGPNRTTSRSDVRVTGDAVGALYDRRSNWANATVRYHRSVTGNTTNYDRQTFEPGERRNTNYDYLLREIGQLLNRTVVEDVTYVETTDGTDRYRVTGTLPNGGRQCTGVDRAEEVDGEVELVVDADGFVRGYEQRIPRCTSTGPDERANETSIQTTYYENVGSTNVSTPQWVAEADERIANREYVAPGVTTDRLVDRAALSEAHWQVVRDTPLRMTEERGSLVDGDRVTDRVERRVVGTDGRFSTEIVETGERKTSQHQWSNASVSYVQRVDGNQTRYYRHDAASPRRGSRIDIDYVVQYAESTTVTPLDDGRHRVTIRGLPTQYYTSSDADLPERSGYLSFVVNASGFISEYEREQLTVREDGPTRRYTTTEFSAVGEATVERPDWLPEARNATSE